MGESKLFEDFILMRRDLKGGNTLEATWWVLDSEPGMDDVMEQAGDSLKKMTEETNIQPFQDRNREAKLFLAQYRFPIYGQDDPGVINFLAGFPIDCTELLVVVGEISTRDEVKNSEYAVVKEGQGKVVPPIPDKFFYWPDAEKILLNFTGVRAKNVALFAKTLDGGEDPKNAHWFLQASLDKMPDGSSIDTKKFPVPGEFLALGVRLMPDMPWGHQLSSPFFWSGYWMDTVYYTSGEIIEVIEAQDPFIFKTYRVRWRKNEVIAWPTDFAEYRVGDRVCILKDVGTDKKVQTWKDEDMKTWGDNWQIAPITFYGYGYDQEA